GRSDHRPTHPDIPVPRAPMPPTETMVIGKWRTPPSKLRAQGHGSMLPALVDAPDVPARVRRAAARVAGHEEGFSVVADVMQPSVQFRIDPRAVGVDRRRAPFEIDEAPTVIRPGYPVDETVPHLGDVDAGLRPFEHNGRAEPLAVRVGSAVAHHP